jgi:hypothetical protein
VDAARFFHDASFWAELVQDLTFSEGDVDGAFGDVGEVVGCVTAISADVSSWKIERKLV